MEDNLATEASLHQSLSSDEELLFGRFQIEELIESGGQGKVYKALDVTMNRVVALKVLLAESNKPEDLIRFQNEARLASKIHHPNVAKIYDFGVHSGDPYLCMEWVQGESLKNSLDNQGRLSLRHFLLIFAQITKALALAHEQGIIHRDIKPANIIVSTLEDGSPFATIVDFGIAKKVEPFDVTHARVTATGCVVGSPLYMSPEQARAEPLTTKSDAYSLGCVMWEALVGRPPFSGDTAIETILQHQQANLESLSTHLRELPASLIAVIDGLLKKDPELRPDLGKDVVPVLEKLCQEVPDLDSSLSSSRIAVKKESRDFIRLKGAWIGLFLLLGGLSIFVYVSFTQAVISEKAAKVVLTEDFERAPSAPDEAEPFMKTFAKKPKPVAKPPDKPPNLGLAKIPSIQKYTDAIKAKDNAKIIKEGIALLNSVEPQVRKNGSRDVSISMSDIAFSVADSYLLTSNYIEAIAWFKQSLRHATDAKDFYRQMASLDSILRIQMTIPKYRVESEFKSLIKMGDELMKLHEGPDSIVIAQRFIFDGDLHQNDHRTALQYYRRCLMTLSSGKLRRSSNLSRDMLYAQCNIHMGFTHYRAGHSGEAEQCLRTGVKAIERVKFMGPDVASSALHAHLTLIAMAQKRGDMKDALKLIKSGERLVSKFKPDAKLTADLYKRKSEIGALSK